MQLTATQRGSRRVWAFIVMVALGTMGGCSSKSSHNKEVGDAGGSGGQAGNGGAGTGGTAGDAAVDGAPPTKQGVVQFYQFHGVQSTGSTLWARGSFPSDPGPDCTTTTKGPCDVVVCTTDTPPGPAEDAGPIGISNVNTGTALPTLKPEPDGGYLPLQLGMSEVFSQGGDPIKTSAQGGKVPAFESTQKLPAKATLSTSSSSLKTLYTQEDYQLAWTGGANDNPVVVTIFTLPPSGSSAPGPKVICEFPGNLQTATVPSSVMTLLSGSTAATVYITNLSRETVNAGDYAVEVRIERGLITDENKGALLSNVPIQP